MAITSTENCGVCGTELVYGEAPVSSNCAYCGTREDTLIFCPNGHYVCDSCHRRDALSVVDLLVHTSRSTSPHELLETLMAHPSVPMHGPEHHVFVPCSLVAAVRNSGHPVPRKAVQEAVRRGSKVPGGWCGSHGVCGAAAGGGDSRQHYHRSHAAEGCGAHPGQLCDLSGSGRDRRRPPAML